MYINSASLVTLCNCYLKSCILVQFCFLSCVLLFSECQGKEDFISLTAVCFTPATVYLNRSVARTTTCRSVTSGNSSTRSCYAEPGTTISTHSCSHGNSPDTTVSVVSAGSICCWKCGRDHSYHSKHSHARYLELFSPEYSK